MLNITENRISDTAAVGKFKAFSSVREARAEKWISIIIIGLLFLSLALLFLPWTQNITAKGYVTTRSPEQRPQGIQAVIAGQINNWYVQEGDFVSVGDTIAYITEVKSEYFDPQLVDRTAEQVDAKQAGVRAYEDKVQALKNVYGTLQKALILKREQVRNKAAQVRNKIAIDSADLIANRAQLDIAENQVTRIQELYDKDLKTLSELQEKEAKAQEMRAKVTSQENKLLNQRNELANAILQMTLTEREYAEKLAKNISDQQSALSARAKGVGETAKLQNTLSNYTARRAFYYILAPQDGYITKTIKKGVGEIIKEGDNIATIAPSQYDLAVEMYVKPQDLPLLSLGEQARLRFDGWPAIVISGWPEASTGIFTGQVVAIDRFNSDNGSYRILISPLDTERDWPQELRVGAGAQAFVLLQDVPIWYELWRQLNGFPAEYYQADEKAQEAVKTKAPLKSIK